MIGTIVNVTTIVVGSTIGNVFKKGMSETYQDILMQAMGLAVMALGVNSIVKYMPDSQYPVLFIISLAIGGLIGEKLNLEQGFKKAVSRFTKGNLAEGLTTAILLFCMGTLSIIGPIESALNNNHTYLFTNAILDGVTSIVLASTFGIGIVLLSRGHILLARVIVRDGRRSLWLYYNGAVNRNIHHWRHINFCFRLKHFGYTEFQNHESHAIAVDPGRIHYA